jgi:biopolymer transport protein TolR
VAKRGLGHSSVNADINVTPMADIMLVLLIIFMITAPLLQSGITVSLPKAKNPLDAPKIDDPKSVVIALNREGKIYIAKQIYGDAKKPGGTDALYKYLIDKFPAGEVNKTIYLKADTGLDYGTVVEIVNGCRSAGIDKIGLVAEKEKD